MDIRGTLANFHTFISSTALFNLFEFTFSLTLRYVIRLTCLFRHIPISTITNPFPQSFLVNLLPDDRFLVALVFSIESFTSVVQLLGYESNILMTPVL
jgi:hypothetical protein